MKLVFGILLLLALPLVVARALHRVFQSRIKVVALLWVVNCIVFVVVTGAELLLMRYFHAKQAARNCNYDDIGVRYTISEKK